MSFIERLNVLCPLFRESFKRGSLYPLLLFQFGKGIYYADMSSKSANYCFATRAKNEGLVLLSEVSIVCMYMYALWYCFVTIVVVVVVVYFYFLSIYGNRLSKFSIHWCRCFGFSNSVDVYIPRCSVGEVSFIMCCFINRESLFIMYSPTSSSCNIS